MFDIMIIVRQIIVHMKFVRTKMTNIYIKAIYVYDKVSTKNVLY